MRFKFCFLFQLTKNNLFNFDQKKKKDIDRCLYLFIDFSERKYRLRSSVINF